MVKIFDINEGNIVININCLLIPELKAISDEYEDPIPVFGYIHFMTDPKSPYNNLPEDEKEEKILEDYPGDYTIDDELIFKAVEKVKLLVETPSMRLLRQSKVGLKKLGDIIELTSIRDEDKGGNFAGYRAALKDIADINRKYKELEKDVEEELRVRGQGNLGYDEIYDDK